MSKSYSSAVKGSQKIIFNLKDVNKADVFTRDVSDRTMLFQSYYKQYSLYMVDRAECVVARHNFNLGKYPNPRQKHGIK